MTASYIPSICLLAKNKFTSIFKIFYILINMKNRKARQIIMEYGQGNGAIRYPAFAGLVAYYQAIEQEAGE